MGELLERIVEVTHQHYKKAKPFFVRENIPHAVAEGVASASGLSVLFGISFNAEALGLSSEANVIATFLLKSTVSNGVYLGAYSALSYAMGQAIDFKNKWKQTLTPTGWGFTINGLLRTGGHYGLIKSGLVPIEWAAPAVYLPSGLIAWTIKQRKSYQHGILRYGDPMGQESYKTQHPII